MYCSNCGFKIETEATYCSNCGNPINQQNKENSVKNKSKSSAYNERQHQSFTQQLPVPKRNYWKYGGVLLFGLIFSILGVMLIIPIFLGFSPFHIRMSTSFPMLFLIFPFLGLITTVATLFYCYYIYLNFDDLQRLQHRTHPSDVYPQPQDPILPLFLLFIFAPITFFFKYDQLHKHIKDYHGESTNLPPSPIAFIGVWIITVVMSFMAVPAILIFGSAIIGLLPLIIIIIGLLFYLLKMEESWQLNLNRHIEQHNL